MRQRQAACQPPSSRNGLAQECPPHTLSSYFSSQPLFTPWPAFLLPPFSTFTSDFYFMEFGIEVIQQCRQYQVLQEKKKIQRNLTKKKYINKKVPKGGDSHLLRGAMASNSTFLSHPVGWKKKEAPLGSHNKFWGSFTKVPKTGQRSEISRQLSQAALEGRGP